MFLRERDFDLAEIADTIGAALTDLLLSRQEEEIYTDENWKSEEDVDLILTPYATVQGLVLTEEGLVASNTKVELFDKNGDVIFSALTDENGRYQFLLDKNKEYEIVSIPGLRGRDHKEITLKNLSKIIGIPTPVVIC